MLNMVSNKKFNSYSTGKPARQGHSSSETVDRFVTFYCCCSKTRLKKQVRLVTKSVRVLSQEDADRQLRASIKAGHGMCQSVANEVLSMHIICLSLIYICIFF